jgi:hypothetical protein
MQGTCSDGLGTISQFILDHLLGRIAKTSAVHEPFDHIYLEDVFPAEIYERMLHSLPPAEIYTRAAERHYGNGQHIRSMFALSQPKLAGLSSDQQELWRGVAEALTAPQLKQAMFGKLARDLMLRYGVPAGQVPQLPGFSRPTLYRETEGFEIPPHPDTRKKVVTMHLYLPADRSQLELGTALYRRRLLAWPFGAWQGRFEKVKQFVFQPNSAYAFVVNNKIARKSWHGREKLPPGAGVRNTLLNTFYEEPREEFRSDRQAA